MYVFVMFAMVFEDRRRVDKYESSPLTNKLLSLLRLLEYPFRNLEPIVIVKTAITFVELVYLNQ